MSISFAAVLVAGLRQPFAHARRCWDAGLKSFAVGQEVDPYRWRGRQRQKPRHGRRLRPRRFAVIRVRGPVLFACVNQRALTDFAGSF